MKKFSVLAITAVLSLSAVTANAAPIPRESATSVRLPLANVSLSAARPSCRHAINATEEQIQITENLMSDILDEVYAGEGYGTASARANNRIRNAVIAHQTNGYGYAILSAISQNAIRTVRDMYLRPDYYNQLEEKLKVLLADLIADVQNGKDYYIAYEEAKTKIYQSVNPSYNPSIDRAGDFCYWNIPAVDSAEFTVARKLLLEAVQNKNQ